MYQPSYSIVRRPVDSAFADVMAEVFFGIVRETQARNRWNFDPAGQARAFVVTG